MKVAHQCAAPHPDVSWKAGLSAMIHVVFTWKRKRWRCHRHQGNSFRGRVEGPRARRRLDPAAADWCVLVCVQLLGEHHDYSAGAADVGEPVKVLVTRYPAQRVTAMVRGDHQGGVEVIN